MSTQLAALSEERRNGLTERQLPRPESEARRKSYRSSGERDRDRILYSSALHRLAYVTQVTAPESGHTFHNRLSHSLKVAQVGRRNAERLRTLADRKEITGASATLVDALDPDAVEASCLAHDLGHPPFGHIAEEVLHKRAQEHVSDGFEGNAQSFRIVTRLAIRDENPGLNLTRQTLDGLLKYPWPHVSPDPLEKRDSKWGHYTDDQEAFDFVRALAPPPAEGELPQRSLEAEIMEWADDVTYAVHDLDDFYRAGLIPLDRLAAGGPELKRFGDLLNEAITVDPGTFKTRYDTPAIVEAVRVVASRFGVGEPYANTAPNRAAMREFGSKLITDYLEAFTLADAQRGDGIVLSIDDNAYLQVVALKQLVKVYVIRRPGLAVVQHGQRRVISDLFDWYYEATHPTNGDRRLFPPGAQERLRVGPETSATRARIVVDLVSGLTEDAALQLHRRLAGGDPAPTLDDMALMA